MYSGDFELSEEILGVFARGSSKPQPRPYLRYQLNDRMSSFHSHVACGVETIFHTHALKCCVMTKEKSNHFAMGGRTWFFHVPKILNNNFFVRNSNMYLTKV